MPARHVFAGQRMVALIGALAFLVLFGVVASAMTRPAPRVLAREVTDHPHAADPAPAPAAYASPSPAASASPALAASASPAPAASASPAPARADAIRPTRVRIPAIDVAAPVIELGLAHDGTLEVPASFAEAGWWTGGAAPGSDGPAVVAGHVDSRSGPGVFFRLHELRPGDVIELRDDRDRVVRFAVDRVERHAKDRFPTDAVYGDTPEPVLRVITCGGAFDRTARSYIDNVIVFASLID